MTVLAKTLRARKIHKCDRCNDPINPGEVYIRYSLTPGDSEHGNDHWWVLHQHLDDDYLCLASSGRL